MLRLLQRSGPTYSVSWNPSRWFSHRN